MPSDKIQRIAVAIKGLERKITEASNEIDRKPSKGCPECAQTFMGVTFCSNCGTRLA